MLMELTNPESIEEIIKEQLKYGDEGIKNLSKLIANMMDSSEATYRENRELKRYIKDLEDYNKMLKIKLDEYENDKKDNH